MSANSSWGTIFEINFKLQSEGRLRLLLGIVNIQGPGHRRQMYLHPRMCNLIQRETVHLEMAALQREPLFQVAGQAGHTNGHSNRLYSSTRHISIMHGIQPSIDPKPSSSLVLLLLKVLEITLFAKVVGMAYRFQKRFDIA